MEDKVYDSTADTTAHIKRVRELLSEFALEILLRGHLHDQSKLEEPEKSAFDIATPKLASLVYGSPEYQQSLDELKPALDHHYANNQHHPQYFENGVNGMTLVDLLEMLVDWKAAGERNKGGDILRSIEINKDRFNISPQLTEILNNTAKYYFINEK